jgi:hypothetical protein
VVLASVTLGGLVAGGLLAQGLADVLETTGLFHYDPEEEDKESDNNPDAAQFTVQDDIARNGTIEFSSPKEAELYSRRIALESTGDLTLNLVVNVQQWDGASLIFPSPFVFRKGMDQTPYLCYYPDVESISFVGLPCL